MIFIYEDDQWRNLLPLVHLRPVFDLRCGCRTLLEKYQALYPREKLGLLVRPELMALTAEQHPKLQIGTVGLVRHSKTSVLFLSGRAILDKPLPVRGPEEIFVNGKEIVGFRVNPARIRSLPVSPAKVRSWRLPERKVLASIVRFPWNLIEFNEPELVRELREESKSRKIRRSKGPGTSRLLDFQTSGLLVIGNPRNLKLARSAQVEPGVVFDLRLGGILVDEQARVRTRSVVAGPCYVGKGTVLDAALVRPGCSFGPECRIGGEVEASIFLGHANKHHEGFIGHAVVGEWVNLGALTTNSDLRNDYGEAKVVLTGAAGSQPQIHADENRWFGSRRESAFVGGKSYRLLNTGLRKFGCVIGDHAKTAIGSLLNTGAVLGIFANWFEPGLSPKAVPDFARGSLSRRFTPMKTDSSRVGGNRRSSAAERFDRESVEELLATARIVMSRRGARLSPDYERLVRRIYARK